MNNCIRFFNTIRYLKFIQIYYRLFYFVRIRFRKATKFKYDFIKELNSTLLKLLDSCEYYSKHKNNEFHMLNLSKKFEKTIDWNYNGYGKLWTYNLTYFEYLKNKEDISLIYDLIDNITNIKDGFDPFPISLRGINWIKFLTKYNIKDEKIDVNLYSQYCILLDNLEYHLLGNHLLENGFSILFGAFYFQDDVLYKKAKEILEKELKEQILDDGAHFELSPMYHQLMLFRVLDCLNLVMSNEWKDKELERLLRDKAAVMCGWLKAMTFEDGSIPLFNDSAEGIAPSTEALLSYAERLQVKPVKVFLSESGYRQFVGKYYECVVDVGAIGPDYIPGHAHADTFSFCLHVNSKPFIVDTGLSTYEVGDTRNIERSTKAHNTVEINDQNSSEVWSGFRVADRAKVIDLIEKNNYIQATHDGYKKKFGILHTRSWKFEQNTIIIEDSLNKEHSAIFRLHFHPEVEKEKIINKINLDNLEYTIDKYGYSPEFNKTMEAFVLEISFKKFLKVEIAI